MLGIDVIKQTLEGTTNKISPSILKKIALAKINSEMRSYYDYTFKTNIDRIANEKFSDEQKTELFNFFKDEAYQSYEKAKKDIEEIFGSEKQESAKTDEKLSNEKEVIGKSEEGEADEYAQDDSKDEHKTPAEYVIEKKPGQSLFNY